jgi:type IV secretory pathway TrbL component
MFSKGLLLSYLAQQSISVRAKTLILRIMNFFRCRSESIIYTVMIRLMLKILQTLNLLLHNRLHTASKLTILRYEHIAMLTR